MFGSSMGTANAAYGWVARLVSKLVLGTAEIARRGPPQNQEYGALASTGRILAMFRGVAQPGSAPAWGAGGSLVRIQSPRPTQHSPEATILCGSMTAVAVRAKYAALLYLNEDLGDTTGRDQPADVPVLVAHMIKLQHDGVAFAAQNAWILVEVVPHQPAVAVSSREATPPLLMRSYSAVPRRGKTGAPALVPPACANQTGAPSCGDDNSRTRHRTWPFRW